MRASDYVTVSWCKFYYVNQTTHKNTILLGNSDDATGDEGKLHVTLHHNWFAEGCNERMPRVRYGHVHIYNNYYSCTGNNYCIGTGYKCHIRVENSYFDNINDPWADYGGLNSGGEMGWDNLKFVNCSQPTYIVNSYPVFTLPYSFIMNPVDDVKTIVRASAGNVFDQVGTAIVNRDAEVIALYPNPVSDELILHLNDNYSANTYLTLYNTLGKIIMKETLSGSEHILDLKALPSGVYLITLTSDQGKIIRKIIKH